jgi:hypothetical protein
MLKHILVFLLVSLFTFTTNAQSDFSDDLDQVSLAALESKDAAKSVGIAFRTLAISYFVQQNQNPNTTAYLNVLESGYADIQSALQDVIYFAEEAQANNPNADISQIEDWAQLIENQSESVWEESQDLVQYIEADQAQAALSVAQGIRADILEIIGLSRNIALAAQDLKDTPLPTPLYDVRIVLEDSYGNKITGSTGLQGYYAYNDETDEYFFSGEYQGQDPDVFNDLPEATYTFGAFNGYFDGAGSNTVTLSSELPLNSEGEVEVTLIYWSE